MALERRNPLPAGRYWIDIAPNLQARWAAWAVVNQPFVETTSTASSGWTWVLFHTSAALPWAKELGFPTIAPPDVHTEQQAKAYPVIDTDPASQLSSLFQGVGNVLVLLAIAAYFKGRR
jgi:hypothetical protein